MLEERSLLRNPDHFKRRVSWVFIRKAFAKTKTELGLAKAVRVIDEREDSLVRNAVIHRRAFATG
jgi:hypothetical protein